MNLLNIDQDEACKICGSTLSANQRHCSTCRADAGAPNVRACRREENIQILVDRYQKARCSANKNNNLEKFKNLSNQIESEAGVVVAMPTGVLRDLFSDPNKLYSNYDQLVGSNVRKPAKMKDDSHRSSVSALLFGSYSKHIIYGALSLTNEGLTNYGKAQCRLKSIAIKERTTFLERNSYEFVKKQDLSPGDSIPLGYVSDWDNKHKLALAKITSDFGETEIDKDWSELIIQPHETNRDEDEFIEAHIYDGFDKNAIESMSLVDRDARREEKLDFDIAMDKFKNHKS